MIIEFRDRRAFAVTLIVALLLSILMLASCGSTNKSVADSNSSPFYADVSDIPESEIKDAYDIASLHLKNDGGDFGAGAAFAKSGTATFTNSAFFCKDILNEGDSRSDLLMIVYEVSGDTSSLYRDKVGDVYTFYGCYRISDVKRNTSLDIGSKSPLFLPKEGGGRSGVHLTPADMDKIAESVEADANWEYYSGKSASKRYEVIQLPESLVPAYGKSITPNGSNRSDDDLRKLLREETGREVSIGMTAEEVLKSKWGEPESKNITETGSTVREQWVYPDGRYVYLENGIVTAIQRTE